MLDTISFIVLAILTREYNFFVIYTYSTRLTVTFYCTVQMINMTMYSNIRSFQSTVLFVTLRDLTGVIARQCLLRYS